MLNGDNPFILVHSPLISNYDISRMVEAHKKLRAKDPNYIMTMGVGKGGRYVVHACAVRWCWGCVLSGFGSDCLCQAAAIVCLCDHSD